MSISGKFLTAKIGAAEIVGNFEWSVSEVADRLEATTGSNAGRANKNAGVIETRVRLSLYLDVTSGAFTALRAGTAITNLNLFARSAATNPLYLISSFNVYEMTVRGQVRDRFIVEVDGEANGDTITATEPN